MALVSTPIQGQQRGGLGAFETQGDIGAPRLPGSGTYNAVSQTYALAAGGVNMWADRDEFHFAWRRMTGDFILQARVEFVGQGTDPHRKVGWMVRRSQDDNAPYVDGVVHGSGLTSLQYRRSAGAATEETQLSVTGADVLQLERRGSTYTFSAAKYGEPFSSAAISDVDLGDDVLVGLALCAHDPDVTERAIVRDVRLIRPAKPDFVPYRDYIGSVLEILDLGNGYRRAIYQSQQPFEAPNWTRDGRALIYNRSGRAEDRGTLYRFDLATRQPARIDTGPSTGNNNDHVLSFDGTQLGISDQSPSVGGQSTVLVVPAEGGTPRRVTTRSPSYLHGWSPDGRFVLYTGSRNGDFDVFRRAADGSGDEVNLTHSPGLDDGPEYSPDGQYIYFCSVRSGTMQVWRMKPDGSAPEQLTDDGFNNWFPHLSPDGRQLVMISFSQDVAPSDHPYYKHVYLRLMPAGGGTPRVVAYVYGGQGTINVPSWSPDGTMLAFVSNTGTD